MKTPMSIDASRRPRILVVDDEPMILDFVRSFLVKGGYDVLTAPNGEQALAVFRSNPDIDLLVTDIVMPKMDGIKLAHRLSEMHGNMRVLFITGYSEEQTGTQAVNTIRKPFTPVQLLAAVQAALARASRLSGA